MEQDYGTPRRRYAPTPAAGPQVPLLFEPSTPTSAQFPRSYVPPVLVRGYSNTDSLRSSTSLGPYPFAREGGPSARDSQVDKYSLSADPVQWGITLDRGGADPDDYLHNPDPRRDRQADRFNPCTTRGILNLGCIFILIFGIVTLFAGYPIITIFTRHKINYVTNTTSPTVFRARSNMSTMALIDPDTPVEHHTRMPWTDQGGVPWKLVFSDEFNVDNRSFYPGDDPYWEAVDLHYWQTGNIEWYDPAAVTTGGGNLLITLSEKNTHNRSYQGGMVSTWNKFCFTGGIIEASVQLPGPNNVHGLWPAFWTMGNLGRAGYGASLEGMWPYSYDDCDVGTVANQTDSQTGNATRQDGDQYNEFLLSFTPGQRLSRCSCPGSSHPGPKHSDGSFVGRAAPEIDVFEAQTSGKVGGGEVSQSAQWAPFNYGYQWSNVTGTDVDVFNTDLTHVNSYIGGVYQQPTSYVTSTDQSCYEKPGPGCYSTYAFEYKPGYDDGYIAWMSAGVPSWTVHAHALGPDPRTMIQARPIPQEPLYIIFNLGMSDSFGKVDYDHLTFPNTMSVDYVRVYQHPDKININCSPEDFPTATYIEQYAEAYTNPNLTTWKGPKESGGFEQDFPKNSWLKQC